MASYSPQIYFYKPGYMLLSLEADSPDYSEPADIWQLRSTNIDGRLIKLTPVGDIHVLGNNAQVMALNRLSLALETLLLTSDDHPPRCFWEEVRPAILMLLKEERRLKDLTLDDRARTSNDGDWFFDEYLAHPNSSRGVGWSCGDQSSYLQDLRDEADSPN
ncbi:MAG TPA: hypothetical protein VHP13_11870 [Gammaproteobacteria bacterium]|nr:hypothetical protein [Gammaproteobacteria bacterium]